MAERERTTEAEWGARMGGHFAGHCLLLMEVSPGGQHHLFLKPALQVIVVRGLCWKLLSLPF